MPYHCLKVPELLSMIFRLLLLPLSPDATRSSQILRVCRFWFEVAAPILWANSQDFRALARLIAPIVPSDSPDVHGGIKTYVCDSLLRLSAKISDINIGISEAPELPNYLMELGPIRAIRSVCPTTRFCLAYVKCIRTFCYYRLSRSR